MGKKELRIRVADQKILNRIYVIRGQKIMIDEDLAEMYNVETKLLNEQVKRNIRRFLKDFMFTITEKEVRNLKSQIATSSFPIPFQSGKRPYKTYLQEKLYWQNSLS